MVVLVGVAVLVTAVVLVLALLAPEVLS